MTIAVAIAAALFAVGAVAAALRLMRGPDPIDRTAALDVLLAIAVGVIVLLAVAGSSMLTLTIAVVVSLLGFVGSAALALLLGRWER